MNKIYLTIIFLLIASDCLSYDWVRVIDLYNSSSPSICSTCGTCTGCATAGLGCEDFDYDIACTWTDTTTAGAILDITRSGTWNCAGGVALQVTRDSVANGALMSVYDTGSGMTTANLRFDIRVDSKGDMAATEYFNLVVVDSDTNGTTAPVRLAFYVESGGTTYTLRLTGEGITYVETSNISIGTVYDIRLKIVVGPGADDDNLKVWIDGTLEGTIAGTNLSATPRYVIIGEGGYTSDTNNSQFTIDSIRIDDSDPGACL